MNRHDVHLSPDRETATRVGARRGRPVVLSVDAGAMHRDGHVFHVSANGVWLTQVRAAAVSAPAGGPRGDPPGRSAPRTLVQRAWLSGHASCAGASVAICSKTAWSAAKSESAIGQWSTISVMPSSAVPAREVHEGVHATPAGGRGPG